MPRLSNLTKPQTRWQQFALLFAVVLAFSSLITATAPSIDLAVSRWFFNQETGSWPVAQAPFWQLVRKLLWRTADGVFAAAVTILVLRTFVPSWRTRGRAQFGFLASCYAIGPGLVVNVLLKEHWGRARPLTITEFGGAHHFTSALTISDQCTHNCSFVGGEASSFAVLFFVLFFMLRSARPSLFATSLLCVAFLFAWFGSLLRVAFGDHFLSDVLFAWLAMSVVVAAVAALFDLLKWSYRWHSGTPVNSA